MKRLALYAATAALAIGAAGTAAAGGMSGMDMAGSKTTANTATSSGEMGTHSMPGTVTKVDHKTGMVKVTSMGMHMALHFPPPTIKELKAGDKILVHLGYSMIP